MIACDSLNQCRPPCSLRHAQNPAEVHLFFPEWFKIPSLEPKTKSCQQNADALLS